MSSVTQRMFATLTVLAVFMASIDCACAGAITARSGVSPSFDSEPGHCCAHQEGLGHHHDTDGDEGHQNSGRHKSEPCNASCEHCGQTVINDNLVAKDLSPLATHVSFLVIFAPLPESANHAGEFQRTPEFLNKLHRLLTSPTLLSLHCALTI